MKVPITFLEMLSYALTVKGEEMVVSMSRPTVRAVLKGQKFKADPLSHWNLSTHAFNGDLQGPRVSSSFGREIFIGKSKERV